MDDCRPFRAVVGDNDLKQRSASAAGEQAVPGCISGLSWERVDPHVPGRPYVTVADGPAVRMIVQVLFGLIGGTPGGWSALFGREVLRRGILFDEAAHILATLAEVPQRVSA